MKLGYSGVLFDLDGTLHCRALTLRTYLQGHAQRFALPPGYAERFTVLDDVGYVNKALVFTQLCREFGLPYAPATLLQDFYAHAWAAL